VGWWRHASTVAEKIPPL
jgi:hypothetical protein